MRPVGGRPRWRVRAWSRGGDGRRRGRGGSGLGLVARTRDGRPSSRRRRRLRTASLVRTHRVSADAGCIACPRRAQIASNATAWSRRGGAAPDGVVVRRVSQRASAATSHGRRPRSRASESGTRGVRVDDGANALRASRRSSASRGRQASSRPRTPRDAGVGVFRRYEGVEPGSPSSRPTARSTLQRPSCSGAAAVDGPAGPIGRTEGGDVRPLAHGLWHRRGGRILAAHRRGSEPLHRQGGATLGCRRRGRRPRYRRAVRRHARARGRRDWRGCRASAASHGTGLRDVVTGRAQGEGRDRPPSDHRHARSVLVQRLGRSSPGKAAHRRTAMIESSPSAKRRSSRLRRRAPPRGRRPPRATTPTRTRLRRAETVADRSGSPERSRRAVRATRRAKGGGPPCTSAVNPKSRCAERRKGRRRRRHRRANPASAAAAAMPRL